jgi:hypothetical protein
MAESRPPHIGQVIKGYDRVAYDPYPLIDGVELDGWQVGVITGSLHEPEGVAIEPGSWGDAFVVAPDNQRAGVVWTLGESPRVSDLGGVEPEANRFGVFEFVTSTRPTNRANAAAFLARSCLLFGRQDLGVPVAHVTFSNAERAVKHMPGKPIRRIGVLGLGRLEAACSARGRLRL